MIVSHHVKFWLSLADLSSYGVTQSCDVSLHADSLVGCCCCSVHCREMNEFGHNGRKGQMLAGGSGIDCFPTFQAF